MATVTNLISGILWINRADNGWSEIYHLPDTDMELALLRFAEVVHARSLLLAKDCYIRGAVCKRRTKLPSVKVLTATPIPALKHADGSDFWGLIDNDFVGVWVWRETESGRYAKRLIRGLDDDEIKGGKWIRQGLTVPAGPLLPPADPATASKDDLWRYFLATIRDKTVHARKLGTLGNGDTVWEATGWVNVYDTEIGTEKIHRSALPLTWEAGLYSLAPPFSPCGTVVYFGSSSYEKDCVFTLGGSLKSIRWYVAHPTAAALPYETIFFPLAEDRDVINKTGVGERTPHKKSDWTPGTSWSLAPGIWPTGPPAAFMGLLASPFNDSLPTPPAYLPVCDMPGPSIRVDDNPGAVIVLNVTRLSIDERIGDLVEVAPGWAKLNFKPPPVACGLQHTVDGELAVKVADLAGTGLVTEGVCALAIDLEAEDGPEITAVTGVELAYVDCQAILTVHKSTFPLLQNPVGVLIGLGEPVALEDEVTILDQECCCRQWYCLEDPPIAGCCSEPPECLEVALENIIDGALEAAPLLVPRVLTRTDMWFPVSGGGVYAQYWQSDPFAVTDGVTSEDYFLYFIAYFNPVGAGQCLGGLGITKLDDPTGGQVLIWPAGLALGADPFDCSVGGPLDPINLSAGGFNFFGETAENATGTVLPTVCP